MDIYIHIFIGFRNYSHVLHYKKIYRVNCDWAKPVLWQQACMHPTTIYNRIFSHDLSQAMAPLPMDCATPRSARPGVTPGICGLHLQLLYDVEWNPHVQCMQYSKQVSSNFFCCGHRLSLAAIPRETWKGFHSCAPILHSCSVARQHPALSDLIRPRHTFWDKRKE